jgi:RecA/RadA recombinase
MATDTKKDNEKPKESEKDKAIEAARLQIEKQFGKGSIMKLGEDRDTRGIQTVPSGSILLDEALGIGGYPRGRIIEVYGPESSGKTTLALHAIAEAQKAGGTAAFIDAEHALDPTYAHSLGVDTENLWVSQPDNGEQALEITEALVRSKSVDIIVVDSVAALTPQAEIEGDMGDSHMGLQARLMSQALRKLTGVISKTSTVLIFINQIRMKIGVTASILDAAIKYDLVQKSGSWYSYGEERIGQGRENVKQFLDENEEIKQQLDQKLRELIFPERYPSSGAETAKTADTETGDTGESTKKASAKGKKKDTDAAATDTTPSEPAVTPENDELF